jgi:hypothetical protein
VFLGHHGQTDSCVHRFLYIHKLFEGNRSDISHSVIDIVWNDDGFDTNQSTAENPLPYLRR